MAVEMSSNQEDYLESIYKIIREKHTVRVKDIAADLQVRKPSVTSALQTLKRDGLIEYQPYGEILLTESGSYRAAKIYQKHRVIRDFFRFVLLLPEQEAAEQACLMEHGMNEDVFTRVLQLFRFIKEEHGLDQGWQQLFARFSDDNPIDSEDIESVEKFLSQLQPMGTDAQGL